MKCKYCGNLIDGNFCNNCGKQPENTVSHGKYEPPLSDTKENTAENSADTDMPSAENTENTDASFENTIYEDELQEEKTGLLKITEAFGVMFLTFVLFSFLSLCFCVKLGVSGKTASDAVKNMQSVVLADAMAGEKSFSDNIYDFIDFGNINDEEMSKSQFRDFLVNSDFLSFASQKAELYVDYIISGKGTEPTITTNEMVEFFQRNSSALQSAFDYSMKTGDYNAIRRQLDRKEAAANLLISSWSVRTGFNFAKLNYLFQYITLGVLAALTVVLFIWIAVIVDRKGIYILGFYGNIFLLSGIVVLAAGLAAVFGSAAAYVNTGKLVFYLASTMLFPFSLFACATGIFQIAAGIILKNIKRFFRVRNKRTREVQKALAAAGR
ncbi:MAG: hypothetical protein IJ666_07340 [Ruminococcus sp.]|nr:hypothetical protein [Ruminococcus sp.]